MPTSSSRPWPSALITTLLMLAGALGFRIITPNATTHALATSVDSLRHQVAALSSRVDTMIRLECVSLGPRSRDVTLAGLTCPAPVDVLQAGGPTSRGAP